MTVKTKKRRRMVDFKIDEISAVDQGAQEHARAVIMKRADDDDEPGEKFTKAHDSEISKVASFDTLAQAVDCLAKKHECSRTDAMSIARSQYPQLVKDEQEALNKSIADGAAKRAEAAKRTYTKGLEGTAFGEKVLQIMDREGIPQSAAILRAREMHPDLFARAYPETA